MRRRRSPLIAAALIAQAIILGGPILTSARAQVASLSLYQATLMEPDQRTGEVSTDELRQILADGSALVYDSRPPLQHAVGHIPGAVSGPKPGLQPVVAAHAAGIEEMGANQDAAIILCCNGVS